ncbi:carboxypeptidase-like regulatory domain-containing protein [Edaphobacter flagellatus]|uniref:carboxypeptidase-like regulatory domain-containing protein n=1 Tax=Edaphobacter flagellatus TaxID=1933044 RepID=UPI0021B2F260|nr:carboxypeptidase-like regulatory domain-containing protein [Edaphobacter flagellatus]
MLSRRLAAIAVLFAGFGVLASAESITGTVVNKTHNKPSAGDEVVLIRLAQGMQEATRTTTDAKGRFTLDVPDQGVHLVRVTHDKANYFRPAPPGTQSVEVEVFDAAVKVAGVSSEADVMRIQTDESGNTLRIVENFFIKNESNPPKTQFSDRPFEFYLPAGAVIEGSAALGPGGMPVQASPMPLGDPNHYAFVFPIRPGETRFQITYHLPYSGSLKLGPKPSMATDTIAIMMPKSMTFQAGSSSAYSPVTEELAAQTYVARNVSPSQPLEFTISGAGQLPRDSQTGAAGGGAAGASDTGQQPASGASTASDTRPGGGLGNPIDPQGTNDPWAKYKWWILGGLGLAMAAGAGVMLKNGNQPGGAVQAMAPVVPVGAAPQAGGVLTSLKDELFALETDRLEGRLNETEYAEQKAAIEVVLKRALSRKEPPTL